MDEKEYMLYDEVVGNILMERGQMLKREEEKYRALFDNASDAIIISDITTGMFIDANKKTAVLTGYSHQELMTMSPGDLSPPDEREKNLKAFREGFRKGYLTLIGTNILRKDRTLVPVDITSSVVQYGDKKVMQGIFRDVREREIYELKILESHLRFRTLLDSIHDHISLHDPDCVIRMANISLANFTNLPVKELIGKKCEDVYQCIGPDCPVAKAVKSREIEFSEITIDGKIFQVWAYPLLNTRGELEGIIQQRKDITEQRLLEREVIQLEKTAELGIMIGGVAHELRNPLNIINTALYLMKGAVAQGFSPDLSANVDSYISQIKNNVNRASKIIDNILNFTCPSKLEIESININSLIEQILILIGIGVDDKKIRVIKKLSDPPVEMEGNLNIVRQIFLNLITNAIQAMNENGEIIIETSLTQECSLKDGGCECKCAVIKISDNGAGIDEESLKNLFKPFFTTKEGGIGLGLYVTKKGIEKHKGKIYVQSEKGKGTTFTVELPVRQTQ